MHDRAQLRLHRLGLREDRDSVGRLTVLQSIRDFYVPGEALRGLASRVWSEFRRGSRRCR